jgi:hypothetical protein
MMGLKARCASANMGDRYTATPKLLVTTMPRWQAARRLLRQ